MLRYNRIFVEALLILSGIFILGVLFGAIVRDHIATDTTAIKIQDQCIKFGAFYVDDKKYICEETK